MRLRLTVETDAQRPVVLRPPGAMAVVPRVVDEVRSDEESVAAAAERLVLHFAAARGVDGVRTFRREGHGRVQGAVAELAWKITERLQRVRHCDDVGEHLGRERRRGRARARKRERRGGARATQDTGHSLQFHYSSRRRSVGAASRSYTEPGLLP